MGGELNPRLGVWLLAWSEPEGRVGRLDGAVNGFLEAGMNGVEVSRLELEDEARADEQQGVSCSTGIGSSPSAGSLELKRAESFTAHQSCRLQVEGGRV